MDFDHKAASELCEQVERDTDWLPVRERALARHLRAAVGRIEELQSEVRSLQEAGQHQCPSCGAPAV